jgi:hypothetical protein
MSNVSRQAPTQQCPVLDIKAALPNAPHVLWRATARLDGGDVQHQLECRTDLFGHLGF